MIKPKNFIIEILQAVRYEDDKEAFANEFLLNIYQQSLSDLINSLPENRQSEISTRLSGSLDSQNEMLKNLELYFDKFQIEEIFKKNSTKAVGDYVESITPTLSQSQREHLAEILSNYSD